MKHSCRFCSHCVPSPLGYIVCNERGIVITDIKATIVNKCDEYDPTTEDALPRRECAQRHADGTSTHQLELF